MSHRALCGIVVVAGLGVACDAGSLGPLDATVDGADGGPLRFPDVELDSYVAWCDAGPPRWVASENTCGAACTTFLYVPCGLPPGSEVIDDAGDLNRCDLICLAYNAPFCNVLADADVEALLQSLESDASSCIIGDGGFDAAFSDAQAG